MTDIVSHDQSGISHAPFTGVILAGGASRRMGRDKAGIILDGITMLDRARRIFMNAGAAHIIVLGKPTEPDGQADHRPHSGPARAITDYLNGQPHHSKHVFMPVDMPYITATLISQLSTHDTWAQFAGHPFPFVAIAGKQSPYDGDRLQAFLKVQEMRELPLPENSDRLFKNLNHPEDLPSKSS